MRDEYGRMTGWVEINDECSIRGVVDGHVTVVAPGRLILEGTIGGDLRVAAGATAVVRGTVGSGVECRGHVEVQGRVAGLVKTLDGGTADIADTAVVRGFVPAPSV